MSRMSISMPVSPGRISPMPAYTAGQPGGSRSHTSREDRRKAGLAEHVENPQSDDHAGRALAGDPGRRRETDDEERERPERENIQRLEERMQRRGRLALDEEARVGPDHVLQCGWVAGLLPHRHGKKDKRGQDPGQASMVRRAEGLPLGDMPAEGLEGAPEDDGDRQGLERVR